MWAGPGSALTDRPPSLFRDYRPEYKRLRQQLADAQTQKQQQQLERLRKDMGAVAMTAAPPTGRRRWAFIYFSKDQKNLIQLCYSLLAIHVGVFFKLGGPYQRA